MKSKGPPPERRLIGFFLSFYISQPQALNLDNAKRSFAFLCVWLLTPSIEKKRESKSKQVFSGQDGYIRTQGASFLISLCFVQGSRSSVLVIYRGLENE